MDNKKLSRIFVPRAEFYLWIILILNVIINILDWRASLPGYVLFVFLILYNYRSTHNRKKEITQYIENLTFNIDTASKNTLLNLPFPMVVLGLDGSIIWYNSSFKNIFNGKELLEKTISSMVAELDEEGLNEEGGSINKNIVIESKHFTVLGNYIRTSLTSESGNRILLLYLFDVTELYELKKTHEEEKADVSILIIDNYDDLMQSMEDAVRPQMLAEIDRKIIQWMSFTKGIIKKYERDRYLFIFEHKYLQELKDRKFEILDMVKEINLGNKIPVTLSFGIGVGGPTFTENMKSAGVSIDLALGRGGDQVVIKEGTKFSYYGGRTRELEKRTRVKARVIAYALRELLDQASNVIIMGHEKGDVDSLGASVGMYRIASNRDKPAYIVLNGSNPAIDKIFNKISKAQEYKDMFISKNEAQTMINSKTLFIVVDTHRASFTEAPELLKQACQVVVIDHHRKGSDYIQDSVLSFQETYASSTCELVTELLQYVDDNIKLGPLEAEALYAGIVVDTKNFSFKTGVRTFEAAAYLRRQGVDTVSVKQLFQNDFDTYVNRSNVVKAAEIINDRIAISVCPPNIRNTQLIAAQSADELLSLSGLVAAFVLGEVNNEVLISGRSLGDINVQVILEKLGGGGHLTVAGAQLQGITISEAKERLKNAIIKYEQEINRIDN